MIYREKKVHYDLQAKVRRIIVQCQNWSYGKIMKTNVITMKQKMEMKSGVVNINERKRTTMKNVRKKKLRMAFSDV
jgi:hypothetical protein